MNFISTNLSKISELQTENNAITHQFAMVSLIETEGASPASTGTLGLPQNRLFAFLGRPKCAERLAPGV